VGHGGLNDSTYDATDKKNTPLSKKVFFEYTLEDLQRLLMLQPGP